MISIIPQYGDKVLAQFPPTDSDPSPVIREGMIVDTNFGGMLEVWFGELSIEAYEEWARANELDEPTRYTGLLFRSEVTPISKEECSWI